MTLVKKTLVSHYRNFQGTPWNGSRKTDKKNFRVPFVVKKHDNHCKNFHCDLHKETFAMKPQKPLWIPSSGCPNYRTFWPSKSLDLLSSYLELIADEKLEIFLAIFFVPLNQRFQIVHKEFLNPVSFPAKSKLFLLSFIGKVLFLFPFELYLKIILIEITEPKSNMNWLKMKSIPSTLKQKIWSLFIASSMLLRYQQRLSACGMKEEVLINSKEIENSNQKKILINSHAIVTFECFSSATPPKVLFLVLFYQFKKFS